MKRFLIALQFLTILPVTIKSEIKNEDFGKALLYFPLIGLLIGFLLSATALLFGFLPDLVKGVLILTASIVITGSIHLDGFADTCDGFYGSKPKEKILEIMRDSRIGVMGVVGVVILLLLKLSLIASIPQDVLWKSLIMMAVFSRWSQSFACYISSYAREKGKAEYFIEYASKKDCLIGCIFTVATFVLLAHLAGAIILILSLLPVLLFINYSKKKIGGMTGDTIGATNEVAEIAALFFTLIYLGRQCLY